MASVAAPQSLRRVAPGTRDRLFYGTISVVMAATVFAGFSRTYYLRLAGGQARTFNGDPITPTVHLHAVLFTSWMLLFVVQTAMVASRRLSVHRRLGYASIALATAMVIVGVRTAAQAAARGAAPPGADSLSFLVVPLFDIMLFAGFYAAALRNRRNREAHKRLMLLAYVSLVTAAIARMPGVLPLGPLAFFGLSFLFVLAGIVYDRISRGRIHPVYLWGGGLFVLSVPLRLWLSTTSVWRDFASFVVHTAGRS